ncbi:MAG: hypothetical protein ABJG42_15165 [Vibrio splendidus]
MINLQSLFGAILDSSKNLSKAQFYIHMVTFFVAISTIFLNGQYLLAACILVSCTELSALVVKFIANSKKELGQEILRANMLKVAFGRKSGFSIAYLNSRVPSSTWDLHEKYENPNYYSEVDNMESKKRLASVLQESCFWSQHLYGKCASSRAKRIFVFLVVLFFVGTSYSAYMPTDELFSAQRIFILMISLVPLWNEIEKVVGWSSASNKLKEVDLRIERLDVSDESELLSIYADYNVVTAQVALIPQAIYDAEKSLLNNLWEQRTDT